MAKYYNGQIGPSALLSLCCWQPAPTAFCRGDSGQQPPPRTTASQQQPREKWAAAAFGTRSPSPSRTAAAAADDNALQQYFAYLEWICARLGFEVAIDRLKISSRRRQCLIGVVPANGLSAAASTTAAGHQEGLLESTIGEILANARFRSNHRWTMDNGETDEKMEEFSIKSKPSDNKAKHFSSEFRGQLARQMLEHLILSDPEAAIGGWHCGGPVSMAQLAREALSEEDRQMMSDQRGGLKTFLRNTAQLFLVHNCQVRIQRWPEVGVEFGRRAAGDTIVRSSQCLFQQLHPQGCPLTSDQCPFKHEE